MKKNYECIDDLILEDISTYMCGKRRTTNACLSKKDGYSCDAGWLDKETNTVRCCCYDYLKPKIR